MGLHTYRYTIVMKKLIHYYFLILSPLLLIYIFHQPGNGILAFGLIGYAVLYRPLLDYWRLKTQGIELHWWELYIPWKRVQYFNTLYFKK